jgi:hypothetical protein
MARAKPATKQPAAAKEPAKTQPASGVGIKELAATLGRTPKSVRASIRRLRGGAQVGQGGRYRWDSTEDPDFKDLVSKLSPKTEDAKS